MDNYKQPPETFTIGSSVNEAILTVGLHLLALLACWQNSLAVMIRVILAVLLLASLFIHLSDYNDKKFTKLRFTEQNGWELAFDEEIFLPVQIAKSSVLTFWVMILHCVSEQKVQTVVIFNDALPDKEFRKMLALIKTSGF